MSSYRKKTIIDCRYSALHIVNNDVNYTSQWYVYSPGASYSSAFCNAYWYHD